MLALTAVVASGIFMPIPKVDFFEGLWFLEVIVIECWVIAMVIFLEPVPVERRHSEKSNSKSASNDAMYPMRTPLMYIVIISQLLFAFHLVEYWVWPAKGTSKTAYYLFHPIYHYGVRYLEYAEQVICIAFSPPILIIYERLRSYTKTKVLNEIRRKAQPEDSRVQRWYNAALLSWVRRYAPHLHEEDTNTQAPSVDVQRRLFKTHVSSFVAASLARGKDIWSRIKGSVRKDTAE